MINKKSNQIRQFLQISISKYNIKLYAYILGIIILLIVSIYIRKPQPNKESFHNADATYHILLTMKAYDETPVSIHKFLPIVSLGQDDDKHITVGS